MLHKFFGLLFPPKCVLCKQLLKKEERDLCAACRENSPKAEKSQFRFSFVAGWTAVWYYKDKVRASLKRFKFSGRRNYAPAYGHILAAKLEKEKPFAFDVLTYVPIAPLRRLKRGYDQVELIADALGAELGVTPCKTLQKIRNTPPQSSIADPARRRANVLGAYRAIDPELVKGKRILLLDDIITTGATASECARVLLSAGAKEVFCAAMAVSTHKKG